jgi:CBS domain-containing protein
MSTVSKLLKQTEVNQLLAAKGKQVWVVSPEDTVFKALQLLAEKNIGALVVMEDAKVVGILSERDYARKVILKGKSSMKTPVREIMTPKVLFVSPNQTVADCMALMTDKHIRHLPVLEDDQVVGVISIGDVVKAIISDQEFAIAQLENYISGNWG